MQYADGGSFTFPRGLTTPKEVDLHVGRTGDSIATRLHDGIVAHIAERGLRNVALEYRIRLVLDELVKNVVFHDMLGLQGNEVETIWDAARTNEAMLPTVAGHIKAAEGREARLDVKIEDDILTIAVELSRSFDGFAERWAQAKTAENLNLEITHNRGLFIIANICCDGIYCALERKLSFTMKVEPVQVFGLDIVALQRLSLERLGKEVIRIRTV